MPYDKETRQELMEDEIREDKLREYSNEARDGSMDTWIDENIMDLREQFASDNFENFEDFCRESWKEFNEDLI